MSSSNTETDQFVHGAKAIGEIIGRTEKGAWSALESGRVPGARKIAGRWTLHLPTFRDHFRQPTATPRASAAA
ncbi:hypothetical protein ACQR0Z_17380 [Bradyrhizobium sp. HKCCYLS3077]|uniref:hypothetical protein n=1 Tax=Bradyrhizobium sp. HKCCYLS3077 TaxID=3420761 RepID=UPI003EBDFC98